MENSDPTVARSPPLGTWSKLLYLPLKKKKKIASEFSNVFCPKKIPAIKNALHVNHVIGKESESRNPDLITFIDFSIWNHLLSNLGVIIVVVLLKT